MVTYLLGAGASAGTEDKPKLPIVNNFSEAIANLLKAVRYYVLPQDVYRDQQLSELLVSLETGLGWLYEYNLDHYSIDTFARKLYLQGEFDHLHQLKALINIVLQYYQFVNGNDLRYDNLISSLFEGKRNNELIFNIDVNIVSWNYDNQVENSFYNLTKRPVDHFLRCTPFKEHFIESPGVLIKLNGSIGTLYKQKLQTAGIELPTDLSHLNLNGISTAAEEDWVHGLKQRIIGYLACLYYDLINPIKDYGKPLIHYAWEDDHYLKHIRTSAVENLRYTEILVVIGYSFPTFNRLVDRLLINEMKIKKVYFQSPQAHVLKERFQALCRTPLADNAYVLSEDTGQFILPYEL